MIFDDMRNVPAASTANIKAFESRPIASTVLVSAKMMMVILFI